MRLLALIQRLLLQFLNDIRTIIMVVIAPVVVIGLLYLITSTDAQIKVGVANVPTSLYKTLTKDASDHNIELVNITSDSSTDSDNSDKSSNAKSTKSLSTLTDTQLKDFVNNQNLVAVITANSDLSVIKINLDASDNNTSSRARIFLNQAIQETFSDKIKSQIDKTKTNINKLKQQLEQTSKQIKQALALASSHAPFNPNASSNKNIPNLANLGKIPQVNFTLTNFSQPQIDIDYIYGSSDSSLFDVLGAGLMGIIIFLFIYIIGGVDFINERLSGTLDKMLSTPIRRWEIIFGYVGAFGILAVFETVFLSLFVVYVLKMTVVGSIGLVILINLMTALVALSLGFLISTISKSEFQLMQTIPMVITPQVFLCGLFSLGGIWVNVSYIVPLKYTVEALKDVMLKGYTFDQISTNVYILLGYFVVFMFFNVLLLKGKRRV